MSNISRKVSALTQILSSDLHADNMVMHVVSLTATPEQANKSVSVGELSRYVLRDKSKYDSTYTTVNSNSANWSAVFSTVGSNSANWSYQGTDIRALTSNWENTYSQFIQQSANNISTTTTVNANSSSWSAAVLSAGAAQPLQHYHDFSIPAGAWKSSTLNGAEAVTVSHSTADFDAFAFDPNTKEAVTMQFQLPGDYDGTPIRWSVTYCASAGASGTADWELRGYAHSNYDPLSSTLGTARTITHTLCGPFLSNTTGVDTTGITLGGSPGPGKFTRLWLAAATTGTITTDIYGLCLNLQYRTLSTTPPIWT